MTKEEIIEKLGEKLATMGDYSGCYPKDLEIEGCEITVEEEGGHDYFEESSGPTFLIFRVNSDHGTFFVKASGYCDSWGGPYFEEGCTTEVVEGTKTVKVWNEI